MNIHHCNSKVMTATYENYNRFHLNWDIRWAERAPPFSGWKVNPAFWCQSAHISFCTVKLKHPNALISTTLHVFSWLRPSIKWKYSGCLVHRFNPDMLATLSLTNVVSLETLRSPLEFQIKLCECEQCLAAQQEFLMTVGFRGSVTVNMDARGKGNTKKKSGGLAE